MKTEEDKAWREIIKRMIEEDMENKAKAEPEDNYEKCDGRPYKIADGESPVTQTEITRWIDDMVHKFGLVGRQYVRANFWDMAMPWDMPGVLETLTANPKKWLPLHKIVNRLEDGSRFDFWRMVFENRKRIPQEELLQVWYNCFFDLGCRSFQRVTTQQGYEEYASGVSNPEMQAASVITNPLLIDDPIVSCRYCQVRKPGWQMLQYIHGRRHQTLRMPDAMRQAIREDNLPAFAMHLDMARMNVSFSLLAEVLEYGAVGIFRHLLENRMLSDDIIPLDELCCYLATWFHDGVSVPMLGIIDGIHPGFVKDVRDHFGRNLLWYAIQNMKTGWFHPDCRLTPFLLEHGCDPQNTNQVGLTWQEITDGLSLEQKSQMMRRRYNMEHYSATSPKLQLSQRMERLKQFSGESVK